MPDDDSDYPQKQTPSAAVVLTPVDWRSQQGNLAQAFLHFVTARDPVLLPPRLGKNQARDIFSLAMVCHIRLFPGVLFPLLVTHIFVCVNLV